MRGRPGAATLTRIALVSVLLLLVGLYLYNFVRLERAGTIDAVREYVFVIVLGVPIIVLGGVLFWSRGDAVDEDLLPRLLPWMAGGTLLFAAGVQLISFAVEAEFDPGEGMMLLHLAAGFGVAFGLVVGVMELRAIQRAREGVRSQLRAREAERERQRLEFLNNFLRHEVLNSVNVIEGRAALLLEEADPGSDTADSLATIRERSDQISTFVSSIREILGGAERPNLEPVDLHEVLVEEAERIEAVSGASVHVRVPPGTVALGDDLVGTVFSNLLENAAEHAGEAPEVTVNYSVDDDRVTVHVVDDGPGIDGEAKRSLFQPDPGADHGKGLFLVRNLVESYGGRIHVGDAPGGGTHVAVQLLAPRDGVRSRDAAPGNDGAVEGAADEQPLEERDGDWQTAT